jgi:Zn-dependent protease/CBS domain-containing protein
MRSSVHLVTIGGIKVGVHWSWFFIFLLLTWTFSAEIYTPEETGWGDTQRWVAGTATAVIFFLAVLLHELSHSFMARRLGMAVDSITLFVFGGVSNLAGEMKNAKTEFLVAVVGPLTSFAIAGVLFGVYFAARDRSPFVDLGIGYLAFVNVALGVFNLVPGFPLDGGRILRSIIWGANKDLLKSTLIVSRVGVLFSYLLIGGGVVMFFADAWVSGIWWILIGLFLRGASEASYAQLLVQRAASGVTAGDIVERGFEPVEPTVTLRQLVDDYILRHTNRAFPVFGGGRFLGLVTLSDLKRVEADKWEATTVYQAMTPADRLVTVGVNTPLEEVLQVLGTRDVNQVPVMQGLDLVGFVGRAHVMSVIQLRAELGAGGSAAG